MAIIAVAENEVAKLREAIAGQICVREVAIPIGWIAWSNAVSRGRSKRIVTWQYFIQVLARNQSMHRGAKIGEPNGISPTNFAFVGGVVLVNHRLVKPNRNRIYGRGAPQRREIAAG